MGRPPGRERRPALDATNADPQAGARLTDPPHHLGANQVPDYRDVNPNTEILDRLASVRVVCDAILAGHWMADADVLDALAELVSSAARWAERAAVAA